MSLHSIGHTDFSYDTAIRTVLPDGRTIGNNTRYSRTTTCHQRMREVENCDIVLDNVPQGTTDLAGIARDRGLLDAARIVRVTLGDLQTVQHFLDDLYISRDFAYNSLDRANDIIVGLIKQLNGDQ